MVRLPPQSLKAKQPRTSNNENVLQRKTSAILDKLKITITIHILSLRSTFLVYKAFAHI